MTLTTGFLSPEDLRRLTGRARVAGQEDWLRAEGLPHKRRGTDMLVMWIHVQAWIEGRPVVPWVEPDLSRVNEPHLRLRGGGDGRLREARQARALDKAAAAERALAENSPRGRRSTD